MNALAIKLSDYRDVMSDSQTSTVAERFVNFFYHTFYQQCKCIIMTLTYQNIYLCQ